MATTRDLGRLFAHGLRYPDNSPLPLIGELGKTQETELPWRTGRSFVIRLPFTRWALVLGWWGRPTSEEAAELSVRRRDVEASPEEIRDWNAPAWDAIDDDWTVQTWAS